MNAVTCMLSYCVTHSIYCLLIYSLFHFSSILLCPIVFAPSFKSLKAGVNSWLLVKLVSQLASSCSFI